MEKYIVRKIRYIVLHPYEIRTWPKGELPFVETHKYLHVFGFLKELPNPDP